MLNFIVLALLNYLTAAHLKVEGTLHTAGDPRRRAAAIVEHDRGVSRLGGERRPAARAHGRAASRGWFLFRTRRGFELRATGLQPQAAEYGG